MGKNEIVAMILAGGQGSRLGVLTKKLAKPAVPFGGKYRIIDFPLSNCSNSGIYTVGVLTQYKPLELNAHIGIGEAWDLDRAHGGVHVLPPYQEEKGGEWYKGTANAIYQNIEFVDRYDPEYILILSGDHIYKMDYTKMLDFHKEKQAEATIAVIEVPMDEASRFGIMNTREDLSIYEFEEKPKNPKNNLASMGIYIFNWKTLKKYLREDESDKTSKNDFGMNIIPSMLGNGNKMVAYPFKGYWKDVGTIDSLWEANMDLIREDNELDLHDEEWKIYSVNPVRPAQYIGENAKVSNSLVVEGCVVNGQVESSILFQGVQIGKNSVVRDSIIMTDAKIGDNVVIEKAIVGSGAIVRKDCKISLGDEIAIIAAKEEVKMGTVIENNKAV
ncbi:MULTISPECIES: glucose-1-phosphate adenylyltransferase [Clostridium]|jgi:glucose-1-phosphate adenylyltransferase|uniref:Glucose-1-phosphate adenylyltransferase n=3 Tax=Clostridium beijerinckii TaxID=1520 RepID=GLGC_CLOB8|nr:MULTISPECIES: glucose-1-phosphate adenylyltransferase [Clostridium]A6M331.1 RecName: Full=Glucose-1-phosphate adenylyltransferase; AltName: Full=ADP-glucose pyrophosphorylase; Short=ADPGlc PPase; AltName: Full=ADP-glucose synthase [Clostridium beijerinckii NCIMB 8052]ABR37011.1 glucose-1-phosphate adenylyltransferase [Clostridium beijerinckii NCIMB 8052]AIU00284.1 glucose-1-phosphate adenylyltransferase [Clostridium beijerinckii ATCC 35702]AVK48826.1 glucose-1-phosphate adenylyltransferase [